MKVCRECSQEKPLSEFYKQAKMADGHLNKCIECVKARVAKHREDNIERVQEYDRKRSLLPHRVDAPGCAARGSAGAVGKAAPKGKRDSQPGVGRVSSAPRHGEDSEL